MTNEQIAGYVIAGFLVFGATPLIAILIRMWIKLMWSILCPGEWAKDDWDHAPSARGEPA